MARPKFADAWAASLLIYSPANSAEKVAQTIGGAVARNIALPPPMGWSNTCAVRISYILNKTGVLIPQVAAKTVTGADRANYFFRVPDVIAFLTQRWGRPDAEIEYPPSGGGSLAGRQGLILFEVTGWRDARGHATLFNGQQCYDHCYFNEPGATYSTDAANFWALP